MSKRFTAPWKHSVGTDPQQAHAIVLDPTQKDDQDRLMQMYADGQVWRVHDHILEQVEELVDCRNPHEKLKADALRARALQHLGDVPADSYGRWVYYPWRQELVHILPEPEFLQVRTSRNRYRITPDEQATLSTKRVGVLGLSVGSSTALTMALEGIGGELRIADFDELSLSNTNRLRTSIANIGVNKAVLCAREMAEINPYLRIRLWTEGLNEANTEAFFTQGGKLDLFIEECDDLFMKIFSRECARAHGIATIMETSDKGMLDIERFDLEPNRALLHNLIGNTPSHHLKGLSAKEKVPYVLRIVGSKDTVSPRVLASLFEVSRTTKSWPQLASCISLGAGIATDTARRLLLGEALNSGRFYIDLERLICDAARAALPDWRVLDNVPISAPVAVANLPEAPPFAADGPLSPQEAQYLVAYGSMAPSGGNSQPWHFTLLNDRIDCSIPPTHAWTSLDFEGRSLHVAAGAAAENMALAAQSIGLQADVVPPTLPGPKQICSVYFKRCARNLPRLLPYVPQRITNRHHADASRTLEPAALAKLVACARQSGAQLQIVEDVQQMQQVAQVVGAVDRVTYLHPDLHRELTGEVRWTQAQAHKSRSGIGIDTLELDVTDRAGAYLATTWPAMQVLRDLGLGRDLETAARSYRTGAYGLLTFPGKGLWAYLQGGRAMQRVWLEATAQKIALHPTSGCLYLFARFEQGGSAIYSTAEKQALKLARQAFTEIFASTSKDVEILLFRLSDAPEPSARSLRRSVDDILTLP